MKYKKLKCAVLVWSGLVWSVCLICWSGLVWSVRSGLVCLCLSLQGLFFSQAVFQYFINLKTNQSKEAWSVGLVWSGLFALVCSVLPAFSACLLCLPGLACLLVCLSVRLCLCLCLSLWFVFGHTDRHTHRQTEISTRTHRQTEALEVLIYRC